MQVEGTVPARVAATSAYDEDQATEGLLVFFVPHADAIDEPEVCSSCTPMPPPRLGLALPALLSAPSPSLT